MLYSLSSHHTEAYHSPHGDYWSKGRNSYKWEYDNDNRKKWKQCNNNALYECHWIHTTCSYICLCVLFSSRVMVRIRCFVRLVSGWLCTRTCTCFHFHRKVPTISWWEMMQTYCFILLVACSLTSRSFFAWSSSELILSWREWSLWTDNRSRPNLHSALNWESQVQW